MPESARHRRSPSQWLNPQVLTYPPRQATRGDQVKRQNHIKMYTAVQGPRSPTTPEEGALIETESPAHTRNLQVGRPMDRDAVSDLIARRRSLHFPAWDQGRQDRGSIRTGSQHGHLAAQIP